MLLDYIHVLLHSRLNPQQYTRYLKYFLHLILLHSSIIRIPINNQHMHGLLIHLTLIMLLVLMHLFSYIIIIIYRER